MEFPNQPEQSEQQIEQKRLWEEKQYQETVAAVDALYAMSLENDIDEKRIQKRYFEMSPVVLQDKLMVGDHNAFFDALTLIDRAIEIRLGLREFWE